MLTSESNNNLSITKLIRISDRSSRDSKATFTTIFHLLNVELLTECFRALDKNKALGVDGISCEQYNQSLVGNITDLVKRIRSLSYVPKPTRIVYIPKEDGSQRPLAIACLEDKIVQEGMRRILEAIYEPIFLDCSHGFRPAKGCQTALNEVHAILFRLRDGALIDIDIKSCFDSIPHDKLILLIEQKVKQPDFIRLLVRILKTAIIDEDGCSKINKMGVPQGSIISPLLANIYLHYAIDDWVKQRNVLQTYGTIKMVRYADDAVFVLENIQTAKRFIGGLSSQLKRCGLALNVHKTKGIRTGRRVVPYLAACGRKWKTFTFLGFVHTWARAKSRKNFWRPMLRSCPKRMRAKLKQANGYIKRNRHRHDLIQNVSRSVKGYAAYFGVTDNVHRVYGFSHRIKNLLFNWLNKRSDKVMDWCVFLKMLRKHGYPEHFKTINLFYPTKA